MRFCQPHWDAMRKAIADRGLNRFVAQGGEEAVKRIESELSQGESKQSFEPLLGMHWAIVNNAMNFVGLTLMAPNDDGSERCPLCFLTTEHFRQCTDPTCKTTTFDEWIERAADDQVVAAQELGLLGKEA